MLSRRSIRIMFGAGFKGLLGAVWMLACCSAAAEVHGIPPNILLIVADDLGWKDLGYQGAEIRTPRIDELASAGVRLNRFYAQPSCSPSRASLMTGSSALRLGITSPLSKLNPGGLPLDQQLLPEHLKRKGYQTWLVGKWHLGFRSTDYLPTERGFDHFYGNLTGGIGYWDHVHGGAYDWQRNREAVREDGYSTHLLAEEAVRLIEGRDKLRPLFLMASFNAPHIPNEAPRETVETYSHITDPKRRIHAAMVTELDTAVGQIIDALDQQGILDNTLVWFMSDNGGLNSSAYPGNLVKALTVLNTLADGKPLPLRQLEFVRANVFDGAANNRPLRKGKLSVYEGGIRVPSFVYWRGRLLSRQVNSMVSVEDVLPTLLEITGRAETDVDGSGQWSVLLGETSELERSFAVVAKDGEAMLRFPWKAIRANSGELALFNVESDPSEQNDLSRVHPELLRSLISELDRWPRGESVNLPFWKTLLDPDSFGGEEKTKPWIETVE